VGVNRGQVLGDKRKESSEWDERRSHGDPMSFKQVIVGALEGGLDPNLLWACNPPQAAT
jgi:hypothetical protein